MEDMERVDLERPDFEHFKGFRELKSTKPCKMLEIAL